MADTEPTRTGCAPAPAVGLELEHYVSLAEKVADDATSVQQGDIDELRSLGLSDEEVADVVLAAAARCFFSKTLDALGVQADPKYADLDPGVREALTVGRPIAQR